MNDKTVSSTVLPDLPYLPYGSEITLSNCDIEPIHIPGHSQAYGAVIVLNPLADDLSIVQVSDNLEALCGIPVKNVLGRCAADLFGAAHAEIIHDATLSLHLEGNPVYVFTDRINGFGPFQATIHTYDSVLIVELEPAEAVTNNNDFGTQREAHLLLRKTLFNLRAKSTTQEYCQTVCEAIQAINGFDRVMAYKFHEDGHGEVIAEVIGPADTREPYLGLHYPATDIPLQARALFLLNSIRMMPDAQYKQAPIVPTLNPLTNRPLDMTYCMLRGYSRMYTEYLENMRSRASMSFAIVSNNQLWGLIACHHISYRSVPYEVRASCQLLIDVVSLQISDKLAVDEKEYVDRMSSIHERLVGKLVPNNNLLVGLSGPSGLESDVTALALLNAVGCAILSDGKCRLIGTTPSETAVRAIVEWLKQMPSTDNDIFVTNNLSALYPPAAAMRDRAAGLLALCVSQFEPKNVWLLWFRSEEAQTVSWAGDPSKPYLSTPNGDQLSPRKSFEIWQETVVGKSVPWTNGEIDSAHRLRQAIITNDAEMRATEMAKLNVDLTRSNVELDYFAYAASHDLKEPIRGINNYVRFLREDDGEQLTADAEQKLDTVMRLTERMDTLLNSLLHYSQLGRQVVVLEKADLNVVLSEVLESLSSRLNSTGTVVNIERPLPVPVLCDVVQVNELFTNLISNGIKYSDKPAGERRVEVGWLTEHEMYPAGNRRKSDRRLIFFVRDNGIGIPERYFDTVFRIFKRLHGRSEFGGGTGAGLTICQRIVERNEGRIWLESTLGKGTTFFFTLGWDPQEA